jgi:hypothetical protein
MWKRGEDRGKVSGGELSHHQQITDLLYSTVLLCIASYTSDNATERSPLCSFGTGGTDTNNLCDTAQVRYDCRAVPLSLCNTLHSYILYAHTHHIIVHLHVLYASCNCIHHITVCAM